MAGDVLSRSAVTAAPGASAAAMAWRFRGELRVTVIAKATFGFAHEAALPRVAPAPIVRDDVHHGNHPARSLRIPADMAPRLERADILFTGHAFLPPDAAVGQRPVLLGLFDGVRPVLHKTLIVRGTGGLRSIPIVYERAFGGIGWLDNPFGVGMGEGAGEPNILHPFEPGRTAGFGPIARTWPRRRRLLGAMTARALQSAVVELPDDFAWEYFQSAPSDQQVGFLRGDEWIVLDGLHPTLPRTRMRLPGARAAARVFGLAAFGRRDGEEIALVLDVLHIHGDEQLVTATWRGSFALPSARAFSAVRVVAGVEVAGEPIAWPTMGGLPAEPPTKLLVRSPVEPPTKLLINAPVETSTRLLVSAPVEPPTRLLARSPVEPSPESVGGETVLILEEDIEDDDEPPETPTVRRATLKDEDDTLPGSAGTFAATPITDFLRSAAQALPFRPASGPSPLAGTEPPAGRPRPGDADDLHTTVALDPEDMARAARRTPTPFERPAAPPAPAPAKVPVPPPVTASPPPASPPPPVTASPPPASPPPPVQTASAPPTSTPVNSSSPWADPADLAPAPAAPAPRPSTSSAPSRRSKRGLYDRFGKL